MDSAQFQQFTDTLQHTLSADERVCALVGIGSLAQPERVDRWSDHDFWVITTAEGQAQFLTDLSWLPEHSAIALALRPAPEYYTDIVDTRSYQDRLDTLAHVRAAGISVCCGGIVGMGEAPVHRAGLIAQLANLDPYPESVPINSLVRVPGTPLADAEPVDPLDFVRMIAVARITMPKARVRLSAGRQQLGDAVQALCFLAGANSIFYGDKLLVTGNPDVEADVQLLARLGLKARSTTEQGACA